MERKIYIEPIQKEFAVEVKSANKKKRNRYFSNASPCCHAKLSQKKFCSDCGEEVGYGESNHKIIKLGSERHIIEKAALDQVKENIQEERLTMHTVLDELPSEAEDRFEQLSYAKPAEKQEGQYKELATLLKDRVAIGTGVFRNNEYQVVATVGNDGVVRIRRLVEESQRYEFDAEQIVEEYSDAPLNDEVVELEQQILDKKTQDGFDVTQFRDSRAEYEEQVIEDFVLNGEVPDVKQQTTQDKSEDELQRLKKLMEE